MKLTRREALIGGAVLGAGAAIAGPRLLAASGATVGQLDPNSIPQFVTELFIPPAALNPLSELLATHLLIFVDFNPRCPIT